MFSEQSPFYWKLSERTTQVTFYSRCASQITHYHYLEISSLPSSLLHSTFKCALQTYCET